MITTSATSQNREKKKEKKKKNLLRSSGTGNAYFTGEIWLFSAKKLGNFCFSSVNLAKFFFFFFGLNFANFFYMQKMKFKKLFLKNLKKLVRFIAKPRAK
jgi:hypothetical protein